MKKIIKLVVFKLDNNRFALPIDVIDQVVQVVDILTLPEMPDYLHGIINMHGEIVPVINIRYLFGLPAREVELSDQLLIATTSSRKIALLVDSTYDVLEIEEDRIIKSKKIKYGIRYVKGVIKLEDDMVLINDIDSFLNEDEIKQLEESLKNLNKKPKTPVRSRSGKGGKS